MTKHSKMETARTCREPSKSELKNSPEPAACRNRQIVDSLGELIYSEEFKSRHRFNAVAFTRSTPLSFARVLLILCNSMQTSYTDELRRVFEALSDDEPRYLSTFRTNRLSLTLGENSSQRLSKI